MGFVSREGLERFAERTLEEKEEFFRGRLRATLVDKSKNRTGIDSDTQLIEDALEHRSRRDLWVNCRLDVQH